MSTKIFTLFIDESGQFSERSLEKQRMGRSAPSQIAGFLIPDDLSKALSHQKGLNILPSGLSRLFPKQTTFHAKDSNDLQVRNKLKDALTLMEDRDWIAVRVTNNSGLGEGSTPKTYTHMVGHLVARTIRELRDQFPESQIQLHLIYAIVKIGMTINEQHYLYSRGEVTKDIARYGNPLFIDGETYETAIRRELLEALQYGVGLSEAVAADCLGVIRSDSAKFNPALQLCDLISHCSYNQYQRFGESDPLIERLKQILRYDFDLHPLSITELAEELAEHRALGQSISLLLHAFLDADLTTDTYKVIKAAIAERVEELANEHTKEREADLRVLIDELEDIVKRSRDTREAEQLIDLLLSQVIVPLEKYSRSDERINVQWARFRILNLALANANYAGQLQLALQRRDALELIRPKINHLFSELEVIMNSRLNVASSLADVFEFDEARRHAHEVATFYAELKEMMGAFTGSELLSSELIIRGRGEALGCALQMTRYELMASAVPDATSVQKGIELAAEALLEFSASEDQIRIYQQRAHLYGLAGNFAHAYKDLANYFNVIQKSDDLDQLRQRCIEEFFEQPSDVLKKVTHQFYFMHLLRLMALESATNDQNIHRHIRRVLNLCQSKSSWIIEENIADYPRHANLRFIAELSATIQHSLLKPSIRALLFQAEQSEGVPLKLLGVAGVCGSVVRIAHEQGIENAVRFLKQDQSFQRIMQLLQQSESRIKAFSTPEIDQWIGQVRSAITGIFHGEIGIIKQLKALIQRIPY